MSNLERIETILMLMTDVESRSFLWLQRRLDRKFAFAMMERRGLPSVSSDYKAINALAAHFSKLREEANKPPEPRAPEDPVVPDEPKFECVDCGAIAEAKGLRWEKLSRGEPVTVSIDHSDKPAALSWLTDELIMKNGFAPWTRANKNVKFKLLKAGEGKGDCHIKWAPIDGPGGTLKFVWQPAGSAEFMEQGGDLSGDMVCDNSEATYPRKLVYLGFLHEVGHVLGIGHLLALIDVMFPTATNETKPLSTNDQREINERHPTPIAA